MGPFTPTPACSAPDHVNDSAPISVDDIAIQPEAPQNSGVICTFSFLTCSSVHHQILWILPPKRAKLSMSPHLPVNPGHCLCLPCNSHLTDYLIFGHFSTLSSDTFLKLKFVFFFLFKFPSGFPLFFFQIVENL